MTSAISSRIQSKPLEQTFLTPDAQTFQKSIELGDIKAVDSLLKQGISPNALLPNQQFPLHSAVRSMKIAGTSEQIELIRLLVDAGADPSAVDDQHLTAMDHAMHLRLFQAAATIFSPKTLEDIQGSMGRIPDASEISSMLTGMQKTLSINLKTLPPLQLAACHGDAEALFESSDSNLNIIDENGFAPIHYAILGSQHTFLPTLIAKGANPHLATKNGDSILHLAAMHGSLPLLKAAIDTGIQINSRNRLGRTPLHYAFLQENISSIKMLVEAGADPFMKDIRGVSPFGLFGAAASRRDPLHVPSYLIRRLVLASLTCGGIANNDSLLTTVGAFFLNATDWYHVGQTSGKTKTALAGWLIGENLPGIGLIWTAWKLTHAAAPSFRMIKNGYQYLGSRNKDACINIGLGAANLGLVGLQALTSLAIQLAWWNVFTSSTSKCPDLPEDFASLSTKKRLMHPKFDPTCEDHAFKIFPQKRTVYEETPKAFRKDFRQLTLQFHSDKFCFQVKDPIDLTTCQAIGTKLNQAHDTIKAALSNKSV